MNYNAQIICRRTPYGLICDWDGPRTGIAKVYGEAFLSHRQDSKVGKLPGNVYDVGKLKLRVVQFPVFGSCGAYQDCAAVMLESPDAQLYWLYRQRAETFVRVVFQVEARLRMAYCGLRLRPFPEGQVMSLARKVADMLL